MTTVGVRSSPVSDMCTYLINTAETVHEDSRQQRGVLRALLAKPLLGQTTFGKVLQTDPGSMVSEYLLRVFDLSQGQLLAV